MDKDELLEKTNHVTMLLDCYGDLLTDKQQRYLMMYYEEDLSLAEIAEIVDVSRNAIYDQIKRAVKILEDYEQNLHLLQKHQERLTLINKIEKEKEIDHQQLVSYLEKLKDI